MSIKKTIILDVQTGDAQTDVDELKQSIGDVGEQSKEVGDKSSKSIEGIGEAGKKSQKGLGAVSTGMKGIGTAMKAAGIGLIISLFAAFAAVLAKNQKVLDAVDTVMNTITLTVNAVVVAMKSAYERVNEATDGFDALKKVMGGLITLGLLPMKLQFYNIKQAIQALQLGWEKSFLGKGRPEEIDKLQTALDETQTKITDLIKEGVEAGKVIGKNFKEAASEVSAFGDAIVEEASKIDIGVLYDEGDAITAIKNAAIIAQAVNAGLIEQYDRQAEQQRQIRDDVNKSVSERQAANDKIKVILGEQEKAMIENANIAIEAAEAELALNNSTKNREALIQANNEKLGVLAQIEGKRSEQLVNQTTLENEKLELTQTATDAEAVRVKASMDAAAELIKNEELRLEKQKTNLAIEKELELERLQGVIDNAKKGTLAKVNAEQARLDAILDFSIREKELNAEIEQGIADRALEKSTITAENENLAFEVRREALNIQRDLIKKDENLSEEERTRDLEANSEARIKINILEANSKKTLLSDTGAALQTLTSVVGEETQAGKALAVSSALINTYLGIAAGVKLGFPAMIPAIAAASAAGFGAVKNILAVKVPGKGGGSGGSAPAAPRTPSFNVVGEGSTNRLAQSVAGQQDKPIRTYVVSTEMTSQQEMDRNISESSQF